VANGHVTSGPRQETQQQKLRYAVVWQRLSPVATWLMVTSLVALARRLSNRNSGIRDHLLHSAPLLDLRVDESYVIHMEI
jgi:hypothetical protein